MLPRLILSLFVFVVFRTQAANFASLLFGGAQAIGQITARFPETLRKWHPTDADIAEYAAHIAEGLGIDSPSSLKGIIELLEIEEPKDAAMRESVSSLLALNFSDGILPAPSNFYNALSDLSRLAHRYGHQGVDETMLFPVPRSVHRRRGRHRGAGEFVVLHRLDNVGLADTAHRLPLRDASSLRDILMAELPELGFLPPSHRQLATLSLERAAAWALLVKTFRWGSRSMRKLAESILKTMASGRSKNFFHPDNENDLYALLFEDAPTRMAWTNLLQRVTLLRSKEPDLPIGEAIKYYTPNGFIP